MTRPSTATSAAIIAACAAAIAGAGCGRAAREQARARTASLEQALRPAFFAAALRKMGGGHFHATSRFAVGPTNEPPDGVNTTTDVWLDRAGNYRLVETNDRDGGRDVVLYGRELSTALRYGKMIRRVAEEPEPTQLLEEALGGPWAAWEVVAPAAGIERGNSQLMGGASAAEYRISKGEGQTPAFDERPALRKWRGTIAVQQLTGSLLVDERSGALVKADLTGAFTLTQENRPMKGEVDIHAVLTEAAAVPPLSRPAAEELALRQRIVPEQKEMLRGLGGRVPPPPVPPPPKKKKSRGSRP
ncbi:MAG: hypothetical protein QOI66_3537 [Myxococcales bacterium]|nr:hypothetical protein [Myxococcales bacterium]